MTSPIKFEVEVKQVIEHNSDVFTFEFMYLGQKIRFKPGQFVHLSLDKFDFSRHWPESRPFSVASAPSVLDTFRITISRQGGFTSRILQELRIGRKIWMKGPYGEFIVEPMNTTDTVVFIAGGTGITPFCSFFDEASLSNTIFPHSLVLYYGAKNSDLLIYRSLINNARNFFRELKCFYYIEEILDTDYECLHGRIDITHIVENLTDIASSIFYLSGPKDMIVNFKNYLIHVVNVPGERVLMDEWA